MTSARTQTRLHKPLHSSSRVLCSESCPLADEITDIFEVSKRAPPKSPACLASAAVVKVFYTTRHVP